MNFYLQSFLIFLKIGLFTIGGGYAMVPLIQDEIVDKRKWIDKEDFIDLLALTQSVPGIFAVNIAIFIGYKLRKFRGALAMALGTILPSFFIILAIALFFQQFKQYPIVENIFKGIRPAVVALIAAPTFSMDGFRHNTPLFLYHIGNCLVLSTVQTIPNCREYIQGNSPGGSSPYCSSHFLHGKIRQDKPLHCLDTNSIRIAYLGIGRVSSLHYHNSGRGRFYIWQVQT